MKVFSHFSRVTYVYDLKMDVQVGVSIWFFWNCCYVIQCPCVRLTEWQWKDFWTCSESSIFFGAVHKRRHHFFEIFGPPSPLVYKRTLLTDPPKNVVYFWHTPPLTENFFSRIFTFYLHLYSYSVCYFSDHNYTHLLRKLIIQFFKWRH